MELKKGELVNMIIDSEEYKQTIRKLDLNAPTKKFLIATMERYEKWCIEVSINVKYPKGKVN
jgi:hypothetical protein